MALKEDLTAHRATKLTEHIDSLGVFGKWRQGY